MSKKLIPLIIILSVLLLLGVGVGAFVATVSDDTDNTNSDIAERNVTLEDALTHQVVAALENTSESEAITLRLTEYDMNEILYAVSKSINISGVEIKSIYVEFWADEYKIFIPVKAFGINSLVSGNLKLYEVDEVIHAEIHDIKIGGLRSDSIKIAVSAFKGSIVSALSELHITTEIDGANVYAEITRENLALMIKELTNESTSQGLILAVYDLMMLETDAVSLNLDAPEECSVVIDLSLFGGFSSEQFDSFNPTVSGYVSGGIANDDNLNLVSKYYVNGYERLKDEEKTLIDTAFASIMTHDEIMAHLGFIARVGTLENAFNLLIRDPFENIFAGFLSGSLLNISGDSLSDVLGCLDIVGLTIPMVSYRDNSTVYIIIQSMAAKITDGALEISVLVNANGFVLPISARLAIAESPLTDIKAALTGISVGTVELRGEDVAFVHSFLRSTLEVAGITFTEGDMGVNVNVTELIPFDLGFLGSTPSMFQISCEEGSNNGRLKIKIKIR